MEVRTEIESTDFSQKLYQLTHNKENESVERLVLHRSEGTWLFFLKKKEKNLVTSAYDSLSLLSQKLLAFHLQEKLYHFALIYSNRYSYGFKDGVLYFREIRSIII